MSQRFSGSPFNEAATSEVVAKTYNKPGPKPGAKAAAAQQPVQQTANQGSTAGRHSFTIDRSLIDYLFQRQEELSQKQITDFDTFIKAMMYVASKPLSPNAPDTLWSNFLSQLISRTVVAGAKGVAPR